MKIERSPPTHILTITLSCRASRGQPLPRPLQPCRHAFLTLQPRLSSGMKNENAHPTQLQHPRYAPCPII